MGKAGIAQRLLIFLTDTAALARDQGQAMPPALPGMAA
jgi:hypothetical protein